MIEHLRSRAWWLGVALAAAVALLASYSASWIGESLLGFEKSPVSAIKLAIIIGMVLCNLVALAQRAGAGLKFCSTTILRIGIMLLGFRLSLLSAGKFTLVALPFVVVAVGVGPRRRRRDGSAAGPVAQPGRTDRRGNEHLRRHRNCGNGPAYPGAGIGGELRDCVHHRFRDRGDVPIPDSGTRCVRGPSRTGRAVPRHLDPRDGPGCRRRNDVPAAIRRSGGLGHRHGYQAGPQPVHESP